MRRALALPVSVVVLAASGILVPTAAQADTGATVIGAWDLPATVDLGVEPALTASVHLSDPDGIASVQAAVTLPTGATYVVAATVATDGDWDIALPTEPGWPSGEYTVRLQEIRDAADGGRFDYGGMDVAMAAPRSIAVTADDDAPVLNDWTATPSAFDETRAGTAVTATVRAVDATGVEAFPRMAVFRDGVQLPWSDTMATLASGDARDGVWSATWPAGTSAFEEPGSYRVGFVSLRDRSGNELASPRSDESVVVRPDTTGPQVSEVTVTPAVVDVADADATVTVTVRGTDPMGIAAGGRVELGGEHDWASGMLRFVSGTGEETVWSTEITVPQGSRPEMWGLRAGSYVDDLAGNRTSGAAWPAGAVSVVNGGSGEEGPGEEEPADGPTVVSFSANPSSVDLTTGPRTVQLTARLTDPLGVETAMIYYVPVVDGEPSLRTVALHRTSGTVYDGVWTASVTLDKATSPVGTVGFGWWALVNTAGTPSFDLPSASVAVTHTTAVTAGKPWISGTAKVGRQLSAKFGCGWSTGAKATGYQWLRNGSPIASATKSTYTLTASDYRKRVSVRVTGAVGATKATATTSSTASVGVGQLVAKKPTITGTAKVEKTLTAKTSTVTPSAARAKVTYQWYRNGKKISGATKRTYTLRSADKGKKVTVRITAKATGYATLTLTSSSKRVR